MYFPLLAFTGCGGSSTGGGTVQPPPPASTVPQFGHVVLVVEENASYSDVIGNTAMPYFNSLAAQYGLATQYFANTHPSIGNYFMLTTGQILTNDDSFTGPVDADNIVRELLAAGKTWKSYAESRGDPSLYVQRHDPLSYFTDVLNSDAQMQNLVALPEFTADVANNTLPNFSFLVPDILDDAHSAPLSAADTWLQTNVGPLIASSSFQQDGLLIIVFDESEDSDVANGGGHIAALVISPKAKQGFQSTTLYQHQSTLRLILEGLGVSHLPGAATGAPGMAEFF
jgi:hypothetical protein